MVTASRSVPSETQQMKLTADLLAKMVEDGDITRQQAERVMSRKVKTTDQAERVMSRKVKTTEDPILTQRWNSRQAAVDSIKYHSTKQGKQVLVNRHESSGSRVVMSCASSLSGGQPIVSECNCKYKAVLFKSKKRGLAEPWALKRNTKLTDLQHCSMCTSTGKLTYREVKMMNLGTTNDRVIPSIKATRDRISNDSKVPKCFISPFVAAKTRLVEAKQCSADYRANWSKLDRWGQELKLRNPGSVVHVDVDKRSRFKRMFVGLKSAAMVAVHAGIEFSGIDGTFLKHIHLRESCLMLLVTRDGNNKLLVIAWCYCLGETSKSKNYEYMTKHLKTMDHASEYMNRVKHLLYSDRQKGIPHFEKHFNCGHAHCIVHIIKNVRDHCIKLPGARQNFHEDQIHHIQQAPTEEEFKARLSVFASGYPAAAKYLDDLDHEKVFLYAIVDSGYATHGHRTSNLVEIMNNVLKYARNLDCYRICDWMVRWWGVKVAERQDVCQKITNEKTLYTPYASQMISKQELFSREGDMDIIRQGNSTYLISENCTDHNPQNRRNGNDGPAIRVERNTVDLENKTCTCVFPRHHQLPCKHVILATDFEGRRGTLQGQYQFRKDWVAPYFWSENYINAYQKVVVHAPDVTNDIYVDVPEGRRSGRRMTVVNYV